jgi:hypothetical protein
LRKSVVDQLVVVTHPEPLNVEARTVDHEALPEGTIALGYYHEGHLIARGIVAPEAIDAIQTLLAAPVSLALAATEDDGGNIEARVCLVLPMDPSQAQEEEKEADEPWKVSVPAPPSEVDSSYSGEGDDEQPHLALLPIGNVVRSANDRNHPDEVAADVKEMLDNLLAGRGQDAVSKAIDDLLSSL